MFRTLIAALSLRRLLADRRGNVMVMFVGMSIGMVLMVGAGVDYTRAMQFKSQLQSLADASVLAGAAVYVSSSPDTGPNGVAMAQSYWNAGVSRLPPNSGVGTPTFTSSFDSSGYYIHVSVPTSTIKTTFLSLITQSIGVVVAATAKDPIVTATINLNGWTSDAGDGNSIYWYKVPQDDSIPAFTQANIDNGTYNLIFSNVVTTPPSLSSSIAAAQQIGFAFVNQIALHADIQNPGSPWNYCNQYGACSTSTSNPTHIFYSQLNNPNAATTTQAPNGSGYTDASKYNHPSNTINNCSLQAATYSGTAPTNPATTGSCASGTTLNALFSPSCSSLNGQNVHYSWNDMGGGTDDLDYNDGQYNFSCSGGGSTTGVILTD
jgi:hypothetical protein